MEIRVVEVSAEPQSKIYQAQSKTAATLTDNDRAKNERWPIQASAKWAAAYQIYHSHSLIGRVGSHLTNMSNQS